MGDQVANTGAAAAGPMPKFVVFFGDDATVGVMRMGTSDTDAAAEVLVLPQ